MQVHRLADDGVTVRIETADQLVAVVVEVALHPEPLPQVVAERAVLVGQFPTELLGEGIVAAERHLGDLPRGGQPLPRPLTGCRVVVVTAPEVRVEPDGPASDGAPGDLLRRRLGTRCDRDDARHPVGEDARPLQHLHATHRTADHRMPAAHAEVVGEPGLGAHHVADGHDGEPAAVGPPVVGVRRGGPGRALAPAEDVAADHEEAVGVDGEARTHATLPPTRRRMTLVGIARGMAVARPCVAQQHGIAAVRVQVAPRLVGDAHVAQGGPTVEGKGTVGRELQELPRPHGVPG